MTAIRKSRRTRLLKVSSMLLTDQRKRKDGTQIWKLAYPSVFDPDHSKRPGSICVPGTNDLQHTRRESPKELSRPLARERDITSRSESRCRRQLYKAGGAFSLPVGFYLRAQRATRLLFFPRESSPLASFPLRRIARRVFFLLAWDRVSIPARTRQKSPGLCPDPPLPLAAFRVTGRVRTTRAPSVRVVVTRAAFCMTKCRTVGSSWFRPKPKHDPSLSLRDFSRSRGKVATVSRRLHEGSRLHGYPALPRGL